MPSSAPSERSEQLEQSCGLMRTRAATSDHTGVIPVGASFHNQPIGMSPEDESALSEVMRLERNEVRVTRARHAQQRRQQMDIERRLNESLLFPQPHYERERPLREDEFVFGPPRVYREEWGEWSLRRPGSVPGPMGD
jgi:hypothetical protein